MAKAIWKGTVLAESDVYETVEGNIYFPANTINKEYFSDSDTHSICPWKGEASYYNVEVKGEVNKDAAWYYPTTKDAAKNIEGKVAFWRGVEVSD
ncbi:MAG: DUF427 domain-containing protein [Gammaproteobacteria bacterium]|jgi:uncharacterized protein (DUF427 family)|nr:DUF427 domain-containing protein [Gammaproteobacteria bacterium]